MCADRLRDWADAGHVGVDRLAIDNAVVLIDMGGSIDSGNGENWVGGA
jgi:hypothetical protein